MADELIGGGIGAGDTPAPTDAAAGATAPAEATPAPADETTVRASETDSAEADDLDVDDEDYNDLPQDHPKVQRLLKRLRKLDRWTKKNRPVVQRVRDLDVDTLVTTSRNHQALLERLSADPDLLQRVVAGRPPAERQDATPQRPQYAALDIPPPPFPTDHAGTQWLAQVSALLQAQHKELWDLKHNLGASFADVQRWRQQQTQGQQQAQAQRQAQTFRTERDALAAQYDEDGRDIVKREAASLYEWAVRHQRADILANPRPALDKVLSSIKGLSRFKTQRQDATAALQQQAAAAKALQTPKPATFTGGQPAPARSAKRETVSSVTQRILGRSL